MRRTERELLFADDAALTSHGGEALQRLVNRFADACRKFGLSVSLKNTNVIARDASQVPSVKINDSTLEFQRYGDERGTMTNHSVCNANGAPSSNDRCNGALSPGGDKFNGDVYNGASSVVYDTLSRNGVTSQARVSSVEERQISNVLLRIVHHESDHCKEFAVVSLSFKFYRWLIGMLALVCVGYYLQLHLWDPHLMFLLLILLITALIVRLNFKVTQESLLVMASVGIQVTRTFALGRTSSKFYHITHINNVVINEAVTMHQVIYYLTILLQEEKGTSEHAKVTQLMPLFQHCWPSLECLQLVYQGVQQVLFDQAKKQT